MYRVSAQGVDERMLTVHYYYKEHHLALVMLLQKEELHVSWLPTGPRWLSGRSVGPSAILTLVPVSGAAVSGVFSADSLTVFKQRYPRK